MQPVALDNSLRYTVDDSGQLPGAKSVPPIVPPRDDEVDVEIISEERIEPTEMQRVPPADVYGTDHRRLDPC